MSTLKLAVSSAYLALALLVVCGVLYPLFVTFVSMGIFPWSAGGSPVMNDGQVVGSLLIGQNFTGPGYFHSRPSAVDYNASLSGASHLGPNNDLLLALVNERLEEYGTPAPCDAVMSSGSGLDPDISVENALMQVPRVARETGIDEAALKGLVKEHTHGRFLIWGEPGVNVLELNLALKTMGED